MEGQPQHGSVEGCRPEWQSLAQRLDAKDGAADSRLPCDLEGLEREIDPDDGLGAGREGGEKDSGATRDVQNALMAVSERLCDARRELIGGQNP